MFIELSLLLFIFIDKSLFLSITLLSLLGLFGSSFAVVMGHGRDFIPRHLMGRGVTLLNLFGIGGVGLFQALSGRVFVQYTSEGSLTAGYQAIFFFFGISLLLGCLIYFFSKDI